MQLARFARARLCYLPTALEPLPRLTAHLGGPQILVKRDDATGLGFGGNKTRKLEFLIGAALAEGADALSPQVACSRTTPARPRPRPLALAFTARSCCSAGWPGTTRITSAAAMSC